MRWEYLTQAVKVSPSLQEALSLLGKEGWELVQIRKMGIPASHTIGGITLPAHVADVMICKREVYV